MADTPSLPRWATAVVTCIDTRLDPLTILGASVGDLHVIRNAGSVVTDDVLRSLYISQTRGGTTQIRLIMHTDCAVLGLPSRVEAGGRSLPTGGFEDVAIELERGVERLRSAPQLGHPDQVTGFIYDVATGRLHRFQ